MDTITGAATNVCDSIVTLNLTVITGITNLFGETARMNLYPNPVKNELRISLSGFEESQGELTITDISGKVLKTPILYVKTIAGIPWTLAQRPAECMWCN